MKRRKNLIIGALIILAMLVSGFTYAYWSGQLINEVERENTISVGTGREYILTAVLDPTSAGVLVPVGQTQNSNESGVVEEVVFVLTVKWTDTADFADEETDLIVEISSVLNESNNDVEDMFNITIPDITLSLNEEDTLNITITLKMPTSPAEYDSVAEQVIRFTFVFSVNPTPNA